MSKSMSILEVLLKKEADESEILSSLCTESSATRIKDLASAYGFNVYAQELHPDTLSGYILISDQIRKIHGTDKIIVVNKNDSYGHKRFTIAHELAHYLYDYSGGEYAERYETTESDNERERNANKFAAEILMPEHYFRKCMRKYEKLDFSAMVFNLSNRFGVSETAVRKRIEELQQNEGLNA